LLCSDAGISNNVRATAVSLTAIVMLLGAAVMVQVWRDRGWQAYEPATPVLWLQNADTVRKFALGFDSIIADVYWIRAVVYFGRQRLSERPDKNYELLFPYLDFVTALDPRFTTAYRFGAIFLSEAPPGGPQRPDLAIDLLERGAEKAPERWEYLHDIAFVYHWAYRDFREAARWMQRAADVPGAPVWLQSSAATMLEQGNDRESARALWQQMRDGAEEEWLKRTADLRIAQLDALVAIEQLNEIVWRYDARTGRMPRSWQELVSARVLRGIPVDPAGVPYEIDPVNEDVRLSRRSPLWPLPQDFTESGH
jgi:tetratricopeptide (TPR) repeat protein